MKILIVKPSALGDVAQALPVLTGLRRHWPDAIIDWVVNESYLELIQNHPALSHAVPFPRQKFNRIWRWPALISWAAQLREPGYDLVIDLQGLFRSGWMTFMTRAPRRIGLKSAREGARFAYTEVVNDTPLSALDRYLCVLTHLGIEPDRNDFQLHGGGPLPEKVRDKSYVVFHPYSRWRTKLWPWANYQKLANALPEHHVVLVGNGPWFPMEGERVIDLRNRLGLGSLLTVLENARAVVSTDSGPAHLAGALGRPTLALFGATDPVRTAPGGAQVTVLKNDVFCSPCLRRTCWRSESMECFTGLKSEIVVKKLQEILK